MPQLMPHFRTGQAARTRRMPGAPGAMVKGNLLKTLYVLLRDAVLACVHGDMVSQGAALSYYTFFAVAPLFVIVLAIAGLCFGDEAAKRELFGQLDQLLGTSGGQAIQALVAAAGRRHAGVFAAGLAFCTLAVAATGVFVQLQTSLNKVWKVRLAPGHEFKNFIRHRLLSFAMIVGVGFLLLVSLVVSAGLSALGHFMGNLFSGKEILLEVLNFILSLAIIATLFAMIFKFLPDVRIAWRSVWLGGVFTAVLFNMGKFLLGLYIGHSTLASVYGAVGSLVVMLLWVYYSAQILLFGAQFTRLWAERFGPPPTPAQGATFISETV